MESFGSFSNEEWESLSKMFSCDQYSDHGLYSSEQDHGLNFEIPSFVSCLITEASNANSQFVNHNDFHYTSENINSLHYYYSQETINNVNECVAYDGSTSLSYPSYNTIPLTTNGVNVHEPMNFYNGNTNISSLQALVFSDDSVEPTVPIADKRTPLEDKVHADKPDDKRKKRVRVTKENKNRKKAHAKMKQNVVDSELNENRIDGEDTDNNKGGNTRIANSSSCNSEDELNGGGDNVKWKTRAGRGAATDPQSLYARKRRERINERLKVLQNLVPNGTKVDISTMLEEAQTYVKFLQLQIKLLSSDEMWMYAPIVYNGMDMGLYQRLLGNSFVAFPNY